MYQLNGVPHIPLSVANIESQVRVTQISFFKPKRRQILTLHFTPTGLHEHFPLLCMDFSSAVIWCFVT